eukprot:TRINITY_DN49386_c0_g2_i1.p1 TRINITY_DN49386_c0_g2~~TRINITY_DN49386_c0_g2_i1.p1  ORF type:complete len:410 (+),score=59.91 TRINITY_DN49386_c0_g2_i1:26-1231(+)
MEGLRNRKHPKKPQNTSAMHELLGNLGPPNGVMDEEIDGDEDGVHVDEVAEDELEEGEYVQPEPPQFPQGFEKEAAMIKGVLDTQKQTMAQQEAAMAQLRAMLGATEREINAVKQEVNNFRGPAQRIDPAMMSPEDVSAYAQYERPLPDGANSELELYQQLLAEGVDPEEAKRLLADPQCRAALVAEGEPDPMEAEIYQHMLADRKKKAAQALIDGGQGIGSDEAELYRQLMAQRQAEGEDDAGTFDEEAYRQLAQQLASRKPGRQTRERDPSHGFYDDYGSVESSGYSRRSPSARRGRPGQGRNPLSMMLDREDDGMMGLDPRQIEKLVRRKRELTEEDMKCLADLGIGSVDGDSPFWTGEQDSWWSRNKSTIIRWFCVLFIVILLNFRKFNKMLQIIED